MMTMSAVPGTRADDTSITGEVVGAMADEAELGEQELCGVSWVGDAALERYGRAFLQVVAGP